MFIIGIIMVVLGVGILSLYGYRKISRELYLRRLLKDNINFEIPRLDIKVPVLEGTDQKSLQVSAGHFEGTGALGHGNYCICGHNSTIYAEIFNDPSFDELLDELNEKYDYIILDTPPVNLISDSLVIAQKVGGIIFVVRSGFTTREMLRRAVASAKQLDINILGVILNGTDFSKNGYHKKYYGSYYN